MIFKSTWLLNEVFQALNRIFIENVSINMLTVYLVTGVKIFSSRQYIRINCRFRGARFFSILSNVTMSAVDQDTARGILSFCGIILHIILLRDNVFFTERHITAFGMFLHKKTLILEYNIIKLIFN